MKRFFFIGCLLMLVVWGYSQVVKVPDNARKDFANRYKSAKSIDWSNKVTNYQCNFMEGSIACTAFYNLDGYWSYTEKKITDEMIPQKTADSFSKSKYRDWESKSKVFIENNNGQKMYRFEVKKGIEKKYIFIDEDGKTIKETSSI
ncbi:PepSY-like domain-containing protein [Flavihumibacter rivuli]|uniref:PepSY-like domain-containing protein n=1 Tax=Flavihumibacter rivuli TaxID=2838156 RepID=UPI001BDE3FE1|nr:PepSY-like domain-containing protein [Flavihumibacter rivuli]ULQ56549.1 PepSY-like domain-containing protein [Flavihumibacter rivuli]